MHLITHAHLEFGHFLHKQDQLLFFSTGVSSSVFTGIYLSLGLILNFMLQQRHRSSSVS